MQKNPQVDDDKKVENLKLILRFFFKLDHANRLQITFPTILQFFKFTDHLATVLRWVSQVTDSPSFECIIFVVCFPFFTPIAETVNQTNCCFLCDLKSKKYNQKLTSNYVPWSTNKETHIFRQMLMEILLITAWIIGKMFTISKKAKLLFGTLFSDLIKYFLCQKRIQ